MTLGELIDELRKHDPNIVLRNGFSRPHSYRGYYDQIAFEPRENVRVGDMLRDAESSLDKTFCGYKGGDYTMDKWTDVWIANYGETGEMLSKMLLAYMIKDVTDR